VLPIAAYAQCASFLEEHIGYIEEHIGYIEEYIFVSRGGYKPASEYVIDADASTVCYGRSIVAINSDDDICGGCSVLCRSSRVAVV